MARRYARDRRGRFSSTGATARGGRLTKESGKRYETSTMKAAPSAGRIRPGRKAATATGASNTIKKTGRPARTPASNSVKLTGGLAGVPRAASNNQSSQPQGSTGKLRDKIGKTKDRAESLRRSMDRGIARDLTSGSKLDLEVARQAGLVSAGRRVIERRMQRAFNTQNGRNPQVGSKALFVYQAQLKGISDFGNKRQAFRRKPMTEAQAKRGAAKRAKADNARLMKALNADTKAAMAKRPKPAPSPARKPRRKPKP